MSNFIFDDGSLEAKVLQQEVEAQVIKVTTNKLEDWLSLISETGITKVYLHFCYEDYTPGLRAEIHSELAKNPNLRIICQYENIPRSDIEKKQIKFKAIKHTEIASDILTPEPMRGEYKRHVVVSDGINTKVMDMDDPYKVIHETSGYIPKPEPTEESKKLEDVNKTLEANKDKIKIVDYGKYSVGGNDSLRSQKVTRNEDINQDPFTRKYNEFKEKRRRKKK